MDSTLKGKRIVLLGGTSGFGLATAEVAAKEGASVVVASSRQERVDQALAKLPEGSTGRAVDMADEEQVRSFFDGVGPFDHLVFTAGESLKLGDLATVSVDEAKRFFDVRFWGAFMAAKYGSRCIRPGGSIVLTSGIVGRRPWKGWSVASSIAGAVEALTRGLAIDLAPIRVNTVCAGIVRTELWGNMPEGDREALFQARGQALPVGRVGEADELAQAYLFLMRGGFSTGQVIVVDGGALLV